MQVDHVWNPLTLRKDCRVLDVHLGMTPNQVIEHNRLVFTRPVILLVNGEARLRATWDTPLVIGDVCHFVELPRGGGNSNPLQIVMSVAVMVAAYYTGGWAASAYGPMAGAVASAVVTVGGMLLMNMFFGGQSLSNDTETAETMYTLTAGHNALKIGQPFPEQFGRFICYPCLAQGNYVEYDDHEQYLYMLGIIGVGEYEVEGVYVDETPIGDYSEASYNILPPGTAPILVPRLVWTSAEISNQELDTDWMTAVVSASGTEASEIGFDVTFPAGLIRYNDEGKKKSVGVRVVAQLRQIDAAGNALTEWTQVYSRKFSAASKDPRRYSCKVGAPDGTGRYEFRIRRTSEASDSSSTMDKATVTGLRGYGPEHPDYGDVTMIECKIRATDQLNGDTASKINVVSTRLLQTLSSTGLSSAVSATRSIVDAVAYMVTSENGGKQSSDILDFSALATLRTSLAARENWFDWRFTSRSSAMEACEKAARCGRAVPCLPGGLFTMVRDEARSLVSQLYGENDYSEGSLELSHAIRTDEDSTCVEVQYIDPDSWETESVLCYDEYGSEETPAVIQLDGCTNRQHAWEEGMYAYADDMLNRTTVTFTTGLKGHIPSLGQKILVAASTSDWGQTGLIATQDGSNLWLSEPVDFGGASQGSMLIVGADGTVLGPYVVGPTEVAHCVTLAATPDINTIQDDGETASRYLFGPTEEELLAVRVLRIVPISPNEVRIVGSIIHDDVYTADVGTAPELGSSLADLDLVDSVALNYQGLVDDEYSFHATWSGSGGEFQVEVNEGSGFVVLAENLEAYAYAFSTTSTTVAVRITPYVSGALSTDDALTTEYTLPSLPTNLTADVEAGVSVTVSWDAVTGVEEYQMSLFYEGEEISGEVVTETSKTITFEQLAQIDALYDAFDVYVYSILGTDLSAPAMVEVSFIAPTAVTGLELQARLETGVSLTWDAQSGVDGYLVYYGTTASFDPATEGTMVYQGVTNAASIGGLNMSGEYEHHFKVAAYDGVYDQADELNFSDVLTITPPTEDPASLLTGIGYIISGINAIISWTGNATDFQVATPDGTFTHYGSKSISVPGKTGDPLTARDVDVTVTPYNGDGELVTSEAETVNIDEMEF